MRHTEGLARVLSAVLLGHILLGCARVHPRAERQNDMHIDVQHDFGIAYQMTELTHKFELLNDTGQTVAVDSVKSSCSCTNGKIDRNRIEPGGTAEVKIDFETMDYTGLRETFTEVSGHTDTGRRVTAIFRVRADIRPLLLFPAREARLDAGIWRSEAINEPRDFELLRGNHPLEWDDLRCKARAGRFVVQVLRADRDKWTLRMHPHLGQTQAGFVSDVLEFTFFARGRRCGEAALKPVDARVELPFRVSPESLLLTGGAASEEKLVEISPADGFPANQITLKSVHSSHPDCVRVVTDCGDRGIELRVSLASTDCDVTGGVIEVEIETDRIYTIPIRFLSSGS